jgi:hypothetical protein
MITINSFLHRARLHEVIRRWMFDELLPGDADEILRLVHFNNVYVSRYLERFATGLFSGLFAGELRVEQATTKGALRDRICSSLPAQCPRCVELAAAYADNPGHYFRETPFHGSLYFHAAQGAACYAGSSRIKRIRRLAEKSARRVVDCLHDAAGLQPDITPDSLMRMEQELLAQLRAQRVLPPPGNLVINDVAGLKVILAAHELERLLTLLRDAGCTLIEQELHDGVYRATNLIVNYRPDREAILGESLHDSMLRVFQTHGYTPGQANAAFREFVLSGEDSIHLEIIVTDYLQMLESEIGRCMHEERIIRQRHNPRYYGQLAQNIGFLMEFLFTFPALPHRQLEQLPVRIQDRYLPDYFDEVRRRLYNNPTVELYEQ